MNDDLVELARFYDAGQAQIVRSMLQSYGIECVLFDESASSTLWVYQLAMQGTRLMVHASDQEKAQSILDELDTESEKTEEKL